MNKTSIEWVKNPDGTQGYTWNPITGCLNGCEYCYARKLANGRLKPLYLANRDFARLVQIIPKPSDPFYPRFWEERKWQPARQPEGKKRSLGIFTVDMGELFGDWVPLEWQRAVFKVIRTCPYHRFYLLTKQPQNLIKFSPFPDNCWCGVTVTNREMAHKTFNHFQSVEAQVKFLSFEPLLDDVSQYLYFPNLIKSVNWVIIGGKTGKDKFYPPEEWIQEIEDACDKVRIPIFEKDNLRKVWYNYPRQEMPMEGDYANSRRTQKR